MNIDCIKSQKFNSKIHNFVIISKNQIQNTISNFKSVKKYHVLVISDEPLTSNKEWSVIIQQKINGNYFVLMTKVNSNFILLKSIQIIKY